MTTNQGTLMDLSTAAPREIDAKVAELSNELNKAVSLRSGALDKIHDFVGDRRRNARSAYKLSHADAIVTAERMLASGGQTGWDQDRIGNAIKAVDTQTDTINTLETKLGALNDEYDRRPWSRFILVLASNGHIHSATTCAGGTIRPTTELGWHPELSGKTEAEAVAELGPLLCTHCFPTAPVEWTVGKPKAAHCEGSGKDPVSPCRRIGMNYYGDCGGCGEEKIVTQSGAIKAHKLKKS